VLHDLEKPERQRERRENDGDGDLDNDQPRRKLAAIFRLRNRARVGRGESQHCQLLAHSFA
jgi:hypothetical protein